MSQVSYPFQFIGTSTAGADKYLQDTLIYTFVHNLGLDDIFRTIELKDSSMSVLVNRKAVTDVDAYIQSIIDFIA